MSSIVWSTWRCGFQVVLTLFCGYQKIEASKQYTTKKSAETQTPCDVLFWRCEFQTRRWMYEKCSVNQRRLSRRWFTDPGWIGIHNLELFERFLCHIHTVCVTFQMCKLKLGVYDMKESWIVWPPDECPRFLKDTWLSNEGRVWPVKCSQSGHVYVRPEECTDINIRKCGIPFSWMEWKC